MNLTKLIQAFTDLTQWVKDGLETKQSKTIVKTTIPVDSEGKEGDVCMVIDAI